MLSLIGINSKKLVLILDGKFFVIERGSSISMFYAKKFIGEEAHLLREWRGVFYIMFITQEGWTIIRKYSGRIGYTFISNIGKWMISIMETDFNFIGQIDQCYTKKKWLILS